jgi:hypothetical protein
MITRYHLQMGGYTSMAEVNGKIVLGSDYLGGTNFVVRTKDMHQFTRSVIPDPYRRAWLTNMVVTEENWILATLRFASSPRTLSMLMLSMDDGESWIKLLDYDGSRYFIDIVSSSRSKQKKVFIEMRETYKERDNHRITKVFTFSHAL